jgi:hypothetical protein
MFTRVKIVRSWGNDDVLVVVAEILAIAFMILLIIGATNGIGSHVQTLSPQDIRTFLKILWSINLVYGTQVTFSKLSILVFYRRVMGHYQWFKWATNILIVFVILLGLHSDLALFLFCRPFNYYWDKSIPGGFCWDLELDYFINLALFIVSDVAITIMPIPILSKLGLPKRQKLGLCLLFGIGGFVCAISIARVIQLPALSGSKDMTYDIAGPLIWYYVEATFIIIGACGPALKPFFSRYLPSIIGSTRAQEPSPPSYETGKSHEMQRFHRSAGVSGGGRARFGEGESKEHIIGEDPRIVRAMDVALTMEDTPQGRGDGRPGSETP